MLREAIARDADRGILLTHACVRGGRHASHFHALGQCNRRWAISTSSSVVKTVDRPGGQIGGAATAGTTLLPFVSQITEATAEKLTTAVTETSAGSLNVEAVFPLVLTGTKELNTPRLPTLKDKLRARKAEVEKMDGRRPRHRQIQLGAQAPPRRSWTLPPSTGEKAGLKGEDSANQLVERVAQKQAC